MRNIAILLDGTWNTSDSKYPSNVVKTAQMVRPTSASGTAQLVYYDRGVGSVDVPIARTINNWIGGAFGAGLMGNIEDAYRFLCFNYSPGDRVFIFGFSRGAFSARSLGGLIRYCGILQRDKIRLVKDAVRIYKQPDEAEDAMCKAEAEAKGHAFVRADCPRFKKFRAEYSIASPTSEADRAERLGGGGDAQIVIDYMGIWDTVGSLGIPLGIGLGSLFNRRYKFHDTSLSSMVRSARHAVAIDERRLTFDATLWDNIGKLNDDAAASHLPVAERPYQQQWFPGDHGTVGGSGEVNGHWESSLSWVVEGAMAKDLGVDEDALDAYRRSINPAKNVGSMETWMLSAANISPRRWRRGPGEKEIDAVSDHTRRRVRLTASQIEGNRVYRPAPLKAVLPLILGETEQPVGDERRGGDRGNVRRPIA